MYDLLLRIYRTRDKMEKWYAWFDEQYDLQLYGGKSFMLGEMYLA